MATNTLQAGLRLTGSGSLTAAEAVQLASVPAAFGVGANGFSGWDFALTNGTGNGQVNEAYVGRQTVPAGSHVDLDLSGSLTNPLNQTVNFTAIKYLLVLIRSPDGTLAIKVGPQGATNAWQGPFGGVTATDYEQVYEKFERANRFGGWPVANGATDVLRLSNPGGTDVSVDILILGTK
jgi:hypothetical protein